MRFRLLAGIVLLVVAVPVRAGLHYSGETYAELPSQWRGFLLDQRTLRLVAVKPTGTAALNPVWSRYESAAQQMSKLALERPLTADETADLGAVYLRLGDVNRALEVLRPAQQTHPTHYRLTANLGTARHHRGDLDQAAALLREAVRLAPGKFQKTEELHLKLVRQRLGQAKDVQVLDDLFGVRYVGPDGKYAAGALAPKERKRLSVETVAQTQLLALWLPADARLLWQLAELANAHGDVNTAAAIMDGCVTEFGLRQPDLLAHRRILRTEATLRAGSNKTNHDSSHTVQFKPRSLRPLAGRIDQAPLPPIDPKGVNPLPWTIVTETVVDRPFKPKFPRYLQDLDGKQVELLGFMQPLGDDVDCAAFMLIEFPVGCWYCEMPDIAGIILVELPTGKTHSFTRSLLRITGTLSLNRDDPENFLYIIKSANVTEKE